MTHGVHNDFDENYDSNGISEELFNEAVKVNYLNELSKRGKFFKIIKSFLIGKCFQ